MRQRIAHIVIGCCFPFIGFSQLNNNAFENRMQVEEADSNKVFLGLNVLAFGKNNEYSETTVDGYTLFGYQVNPFLSFNISPKLRLDAGVFAQKDFGNNEYSDVLPTFSLKYRQRNFSFILGTLEGSLNHRLIEPLYDFEGVLKRRIENGVQALWMRDDLFLDVWVDWQKMIYQGDPDQEEFMAGLSFTKSIQSGDLLFKFPVQATVYHRGGQIDTNPNPVLTMFNGAAGFEIEVGTTSNWGVKSYVVFHSASTGGLSFDDGNGLFINPWYRTPFGLTLMGSFWSSNHYLTRSGGILYPSISAVAPVDVDENRSWFMLRALYDIKLSREVTLTLRAEPFYDTFSESLLYSYGLYVNVNSRFFLLHAKK